jgi:transcriptional regulator with XRE-family HTH domain
MKTHVEMFGSAVVKMRERLRMSTEQLAKRSGLPLRLLSRIESGKADRDGFGLREICKLANGMKTTPFQLMKRGRHILRELEESWGTIWGTIIPQSRILSPKMSLRSALGD